MAENEDGQEKSEQPTANKLSESKKKGEVPRSKELNTSVILLASSLGLLSFGGGIGEGLAEVMKRALTMDRELMYEPMLMLSRAIETLVDSFVLIMPLIAVIIISVFLSPLLIGGFAMSGEKLKPKLSSLNPIKGLKKLFSAQGLMELVKAILKVLLIGGLATFLIWTLFDDVLMLSRAGFAQAFNKTSIMIGWYFLAVCSTLIILAALDAPFQVWQHRKKLRMTKKEVKDERKNTEGNPEVKSKIRSMQIETAMRRMMEQVPKADVVITNPTHFAIALKYDDEKMRAPKLVAKGSELVAARIREIAKENNVPIVSAPPLARAVYFSTEIEDEIPARLYLAIAQILAYVYQLKRATTEGGEIPDMPTNLDVPDDMWKGRH